MTADLLLSDQVFQAPRPSGSSGRGPLHPGASFEGLQRSGRNSYKVRVTINTVDLQAGTLTGLLQIQHLTPELESLVTFFEGEIIRDKSDFRTARWGATDADDMKHWSRFPAFTKYLRQNLAKPNFSFKHTNKPYLFMRWKEQFVVPSSQAQNIHGASFAGFYYLCLDMDCAGPDSITERASARATSPPARPMAQSRSSMDGQRPRMGSQRHSGSAISPTSPTLSSRVPLPCPVEVPGESPSPSSIPSLARGRSYAGAPSSPPLQQAPRPRRASSATFSYAAAVRGAPAPAAAPAPSGTAGSTVPTMPMATPKEIEMDMSALTLQGVGPSSLPPSSSSEATRPILIPPPASGSTSHGAYFDHHHHHHHSESALSTSSPSPPQFGHSPFSLASSSGGPRSPPSFLGAARPFHPHQQSQVSPPSGNSRATETRNSLDAILLGSSNNSRSPNRPSQPPLNRRGSVSNNGSSTTSTMEEQPQSETHGMTSFCQAKLSGFYFFRHSEPYQELSLRYVPCPSLPLNGEGDLVKDAGSGRRMGGAGTCGFEFR